MATAHSAGNGRGAARPSFQLLTLPVLLASVTWRTLLLAPTASAAGNAVLQLTVDTFEEALSRHEMILVQFYAPWCGHCRNLKPEYVKAAETLRRRVPLAAVDATKEVHLAETYKVEGYPTILFFRQGQLHLEYIGSHDNASIVQWVNERTGPSLEVVTSEAALEAKLATRRTQPYFVARGGEALKAAMGFVADEHSKMGSFFFLERTGRPDAVEVHRGIKEVVAMEPLPATMEATEGSQEGQASQVAKDVEHIRRFVLEEMVPPFGEVDEENFEAYLVRATNGMLWVCFHPSTVRDDAVQHAPVFQAVAVAFPQFPVAYTDTKVYQDHVKEELGCVNFPTVVLQLGNFTEEASNPKRFKLDLSETKKIDAETISDWIRRALDGDVEEDEGLDELDATDSEDEESDELFDYEDALARSKEDL